MKHLLNRVKTLWLKLEQYFAGRKTKWLPRCTALLLSLIMIFSAVPLSSLTAYAAEENAEEQLITQTEDEMIEMQKNALLKELDSEITENTGDQAFLSVSEQDEQVLIQNNQTSVDVLNECIYADQTPELPALKVLTTPENLDYLRVIVGVSGEGIGFFSADYIHNGGDVTSLFREHDTIVQIEAGIKANISENAWSRFIAICSELSINIQSFDCGSKPTLPGEYKVIAIVLDKERYCLESGIGHLTIKPARIETDILFPAIADTIYNGQPYEIAAKAVVKGDCEQELAPVTTRYFRNVDENWEPMTEAPRDVGEYKVVADYEGNEQYTPCHKEKNFKIYPKVIAVRANNITVYFGDPDKTLTYSVIGQVAEGDQLRGIEIKRDTGNSVGQYAIRASQKEEYIDPNYEILFIPGVYSIRNKIALNGTSGLSRLSRNVKTGITESRHYGETAFALFCFSGIITLLYGVYRMRRTAVAVKGNGSSLGKYLEKRTDKKIQYHRKNRSDRLLSNDYKRKRKRE